MLYLFDDMFDKNKEECECKGKDNKCESETCSSCGSDKCNICPTEPEKNQTS